MSKIKQHITLHKQVILIRNDLKMNKGKIAAQSAHASWMSILNISENNGYTITIPLDENTKDWFEGKFTKVVLAVNSEEELINLYEKAKESGLLASLVVDSGLTTFNYVPTHTAVAIGPGLAADIDKITSHLKILN